jgi:hypothetical protein
MDACYLVMNWPKETVEVWLGEVEFASNWLDKASLENNIILRGK